MNDNLLVSVVICNYNYGKFLPQTINSALNQSYPYTEVIVVDDGSTDNSREIIASYEDSIIPVFKTNGGEASAFNAGFAASRGDIICFLDADDIFLPDKVTEVVKSLGNYSTQRWCFHRLKQVESKGQISFPKNSNNLAHRNNRDDTIKREYDLRPHITSGKTRKKIPPLPQSTSGLCFTRSLLKQILPMPTAKGISLNESYLTWTAFGLSRGLILEKELGIYRVHGSNAYARRNDLQKIQSQTTILTAYWIRKNFSKFAKYTNKMLAIGMGMYQRAGGGEAEYQKMLRDYLDSVTRIEKIAIYLEASVNYLRNRVF
ncbi:MAG: glycosyltransferase family 2 protein [Symploca sp. SIO2C1]|nr:glycosyltransferase family 2 protein [Symploca sp. SIO2C1]